MSTDSERRITRREFISRGAGIVVGSTILGGIGRAVVAETRPRKPNIVYLFADQMRNCSMGCMGNADVQTPNLDKLAREGLLFTDAVSVFPLCSPHRAMLLTGRYPISNGVVTNNVRLPDSEITIAKVLKAQGYKTGYVGKWHLDGNSRRRENEPRQGFDYFAGKMGGPWPGGTDYAPDNQTDLAIKFIEKHAKEPFCLFMSWLPPHPPYVPPKRYADKYDPDKLKLRPNVEGDERRKELSEYYAMITGLDDNVGRVMKTLADLGIAEDTILCFSSDHGDMLGSHDRMNKNLPWSESINVPFIVRYPRRVKAGGRTNALLSTVDIMPTLLGLCGAPIPKAVQGTSLSSTVLGKGGKTPASAFILDVIPGPTALKTNVDTWRGVHTSRYTYARWRDKGWLLYDNKKDPYQMNNLIGKPEARKLQAEMDAALQKWLKKTGDKFEPMDVWWTRIGRPGEPKAGKQGRNKGKGRKQREGQTNGSE